MRRAVAAVILMFAGVACASDTGVPRGSLAAIGSSDKPVATKPVAGGKAAAPRSKPTQSDSPAVAASKAAVTIPADERLPMTVSMSARCLQRGDSMKVIARTVPGAQVAFTAYYTNNNNYTPDIFYVPKDGNVNGTVPWTFVLRPDTPLGDAQLIVLASKSPKKAYFQGAFTVAETCPAA